ncbi:MAG: family 10 glycosylhydrolase [Syntrophomonadaceae bacterium]
MLGILPGLLRTTKPTRAARMVSITLVAMLLLLSVAVPATAAGSDITIFFNGVEQQYDPPPQIVNGRVLVPMTGIFEAFGAQMSWDPASRTAIAFKEGKYVSVQVDSKAGLMADATLVGGTYQLNNTRNVKLDAAPTIVKSRTMVPLSFVSLALGADVSWLGSSRQVFINNDGSTPPPSNNISELRGAWMSFNDLEKFDKNKIDAMLDIAAAAKLNTVFVHARAFSDAFYKSSLFPWSHKLTGVQGQAPLIDPLEYVVKAGHQRGLRVEAWVNPYRISNSTELTNSLALNNPAVKWLGDPTKVIHYEANDEECLIYNPASPEVRSLITDGILEIVNNYDVDGIHFDDYFYVGSTGENLDEAYKKSQVNMLVRQVYTAVKAANPALTFGISPAGNISNCMEAGADVETWLSQDGYVDYVCPQIYWTNQNQLASAQFDNCLNNWLAMKQNPRVKMYVGLALYRTSLFIAGDPGWENRSDNLMTQLQSMRGTGQCSGFILFDISNLLDEECQPEVNNLKTLL